MHPGIFHAGYETILGAKFVVVCLVTSNCHNLSPNSKVQSQKDLE